MNKKIMWVSCLAFSALAVVYLAAALPFSFSSSIRSKALSSYCLNLSASNGKASSGDGSVDVLTEKNNVIKFNYTNVESVDGKWGKLLADGSIFNQYVTDAAYHNRLSGVISISATFSGALKLDYTWETTLSSGTTYRRNGVNLESGVIFDFANESPSFVRIRAAQDTIIDSISIGYSCELGADQGDTFQISSSNDLIRFSYLVNNGVGNLDAELTSDINMNGVAYDGINYLYTGRFNGNGHKITNMTITSSGSGYDALFAIAGNGAVIENLDVSATITDAKNRSAILVGNARDNLTIDNVITRGSIIAPSVPIDDGVGGLVGFAEGSTNGLTISDSVNYASVSVSTSGNFGRKAGGVVGGTANQTKLVISNTKNYGQISCRSFGGGIVGHMNVTNDSSITGCANYASVLSNGNNVGAIIGGIVAYMNAGTITNNYCSGGWKLGTGGVDANGNATGTQVTLGSTSKNVDTAKVVGKNNDSAYVGAEITGDATFTNGLGYCVGFADGGTIDDTNIAGWGATTTAPTLNGSGTEADPYQIIRPQDYFAFRSNVNGSSQGGYYKLMKDMDFDFHVDEYNYPTENVSRSLAFGTAVGKSDKAFTGTFDGNNHSVKNMKVVAGEYGGFFGNVEGATIKDFTMVNPQIKGNGALAAIAGQAAGLSLDNVHVEGGYVLGASSTAYDVAGLVGRNISGTLTISNCSNSATITARYHGGGLVGCSGYKVTTQTNVASTISISSSVNNGKILNGQSARVGSEGIAGIMGTIGAQDTLTISGCVNTGNVSSTIGAGTAGIFGVNVDNSTVNITDCENYGNISTLGVSNCLYVGGIVGLARAKSTNTISGCTNYGNVYGVGGGNVGGIVGILRWQLSNCHVARTLIIESGDPVTQMTAEARWNGTNHLNSIAGAVDTGAGGSANYETCGLVDMKSYVPSKSISQLGNFNSYMVVGSSFTGAYDRMAKLNNEKNILTIDGKYFLSTNKDFKQFGSSKVLDSEYVPNYSGNEEYKISIANLEPLVLNDGRLVLFYRALCISKNYSSIRARISHDNGETLSSSIIVFENYGECGIYEPFGVLDGNNIHLFTSCDITSTRLNGNGPDNTSFICSNYRQNILKTTIDISNDGFDVGNTIIAIQGSANYRRPGMSVISKLNDGSYAMAIEHNGSDESYANYGMVIAISYSHDLTTWTTPKTIIAPTQTGDRNINGIKDRYRCQAPYIQVLPDGRAAVSYMTNEYYQGDYFASNNDHFRTIELAISDSTLSYDCSASFNRISARNYEHNHGSMYGSLAFINNKLLLITCDYTLTSNDYSTRTFNGTMLSVADFFEKTI